MFIGSNFFYGLFLDLIKRKKKNENSIVNRQQINTGIISIQTGFTFKYWGIYLQLRSLVCENLFH